MINSIQYYVVSGLTDESLIDQILLVSSLAHVNERRTIDWFNWKNNTSPFGPSVIAVASHDNKVVGTVSFGHYPLRDNVGDRRTYISYETFIHPSFRRLGIFKNLVKIAEDELTRLGAEFLLNFPNKSSLPGFKSQGWTSVAGIEFWLYPLNKSNVLRNLFSLRASFQTKIGVALPEIDFSKVALLPLYNGLKSAISHPYLNWRFNGQLNGTYELVETTLGHAIGRYGSRHHLTEFQILEFFPYTQFSKNFLRSLVQVLKKKKIDLLSFNVSKSHPLRSYLITSGFISLPHNINCTFKVLDSHYDLNVDNLIISGIDFHTY